MKVEDIKTLPSTFDFTSRLNPWKIIYHAKEEKHRYVVTTGEQRYTFTKEEFRRKLLADVFVIKDDKNHRKEDAKNMNTKRLHISMAYTFVGDTGIDIPLELLEGKTEEEQLKSAYEYAQNHINEIPVAGNAGYICNSDNFEMEDIDFNDEYEY